ncbi:hypothetical protein KWH75_17820 [Morganella morganii]|uniref:hypothetical protein n=1 Tax=Morganella morganii TaxID=582 RepID=UPI0021D0D72B|nr:hypothetical protein [Morganella morganii]MCU6238925.1 hypothetical protein [Morganella morganii]
MINLYKEYKPLKEMYIPAGWFVMKNNMYDVTPEILKTLSPDDAFLLKDTFFKNDIFIARLELPLSTKDKVTSIISIYSRYNEKNKNNHFIYDVELSIVSKKHEINITKENVSNNLTSAAHFASEYMVIFSQYIASDFNLIGDNNLKDIENYMDNIYNERKIIFNY